MQQHETIEKMNDLMCEAFALCDEYTEVASLFHLIVHNAKKQVDFICNRISKEKQDEEILDLIERHNHER